MFLEGLDALDQKIVSLLIENAFEAVETATFASFASFERVILSHRENRKFFGAQSVE